MKVEAMVFRFSKPSSSVLTSPSAGDTAQGLRLPHTSKAPHGHPCSKPVDLAVLPTMKAREGRTAEQAAWVGRAEVVDCAIQGASTWALSGRVSARYKLSPQQPARQRQAQPRLSRVGIQHLS